MIVYLDGEFVEEEDAKISVFDHGFLYGDGIFEGIKAYKGRVFALEEHVNRLFESAQSLQIELPLTRRQMGEAILETIRRNRLQDAYIRPVASRGTGKLGLDPRSCKRTTLVIIVDGETRHPEAAGDKGIKVISTAFRRNSPDVLSPRVKSTNYLNNILAKMQANAAGAHDAVFLNAQGFVCELTGDNVFIMNGSRLITPPLWQGILEGITRRVILRLATEIGLQVTEEPVTLHDLYTCSECFCTATRVEIMPIAWVDGRQVGDGSIGPMTARIREAFLDLVGREGTPIYSQPAEDA